MNEKEVELAKSWFTLSQIFIILAGFLFTASGVAHSNYVSISNSEYGVINSALMQLYSNSHNTNLENFSNTTIGLVDMMDNEAKAQKNLSNDYMRWGIIAALFSFLFWIQGYSRMQNTAI